MNKNALIAIVVVLSLISPRTVLAQVPAQVPVSYDAALPQAVFAAAEIRQALQSQPRKGLKKIGLEVSGRGPGQSYRFSRPTPDTLVVIGADACGAMYGGLDVAEAIRLGTLADLKTNEHAPYIARRGIKFNLPLDARTPSYSDAGDAAQQNIPEMWSLEFWRELLDDMARHRFNVLSLGNLHPFPSLVQVPEYPDVALEDVMRTTVKLDSTYSLSGDGITPPDVADVLKNQARTTLDLLAQLPEAPAEKELRLTLGDLRAMAHLGNYYAEKILGATDLALFDRNRKVEQQDSAVRHLESALEHWKRYATVATRQYRPQLLTRLGFVDLNRLTENVAADITMAKEWKPGTISLAAAQRPPAAAKTKADLAVRVPLWQPHDFAFTNRTAVDNPFQASFSAEITGPQTNTLVLPGFFDGNGVWKIRVSPTADGEWQIVTRSSVAALDGRRVRFLCIPNPSRAAHGGLRVDRQHPRHFVFEDGTRFFPMGYECDWLWALDATNAELRTVNPFLDKLVTNGFNYVLLNAYAHDTSWRKGKTADDDYGPPPLYAWEGSNEQPDHTRFNLAYWRHYDRIIEALNQRGMIAHVMIKVYNKMVNWPAKGSAEDDQYFRWLIARYSAYSNIHWDFSKESNNDKDTDYKLGRIKFIRDNDPYRRPITTHTDLQAYDQGIYNIMLDFRSDQVHSKWHTSLLDHRQQRVWPVLNVEFGYEHGPGGLTDKTYNVVQAPEEVCRRAWEVCMAGGYGAYYYTYTAWDILRPEDTPPGYQYFRHLRDFFESTGYWRMEPADTLVSEGYCLAELGREYIVFLNKPSVFSLQIHNLIKPAPAVWFHPLTGQRREAGMLGNGSRQLTPPADWGETPAVLHVGP